LNLITLFILVIKCSGKKSIENYNTAVGEVGMCRLVGETRANTRCVALYITYDKTSDNKEEIFP